MGVTEAKERCDECRLRVGVDGKCNVELLGKAGLEVEESNG